MNCTKYLCKTGFRFFFLMIIANSASFVTCCMSINTADFLCQCIVHVLGIILFFYSFRGWFFFLEVVSELSRPTGLCTEPEIVSPTLSGLLYSLWRKKKLRTNERRRRRMREKKKKKSWIILVVLY